MPEADESPLLAIALPRAEAAIAVAAAWDAGETVMVLDPDAPASQTRKRLALARPTHVLDADGRRTWPLGTPISADVAAVVASSGTTGEPKLVELTRAGVEAGARVVNEALGAALDDVWLCCLPLHHVAGLAVIARARVGGMRVVVQPRFNPDAVAAAARSDGATLVSLVPTMLYRLARRGHDLPGFEHVLLGGAPVDTGLVPDTLTPRVSTTYGQTETGGGVVHDGRPLPGVEVRLGARDEIELKCPMLMRGYRHRPDLTAAAFSRDGWLRTGDVGRIDGSGRVSVIDRLTDVIISGGVNVYPTKVERVLVRHPDVSDACVVGLSDPEWGQRVVAFVVAHPGDTPPTATELRAFALDHLSRAETPRDVILVDQIPRSPGGKALRRRLRPPQSAGGGFRADPTAADDRRP